MAVDAGRAPFLASHARRWLRALAARIQQRLRRYDLAVYRPRLQVAINVAPYTDGWFAHLGDIKIPGTEPVCVYLDKVPADGQFHVWTGFLVKGEDRALAIGKHLRRHVGTPF